MPQKLYKPSIEVIILTYNRAELFEQTLRSVCNQTYKDLTIKILNNGSTDNTEEVFNKIKSEYPNHKFGYLKLEENHLDDYYLQKRNEFITADYVIIFHDDDLMHPRYIEYLMKVIKKHPDVVLLGGKTNISYHPENIPWCKPQGKYVIGDVRDMAKWYYRGDTFSFPAICYKSKILKTTQWQGELYGNRGDFPFLMDVAEHGKVCELQDRFLHYRVHKGQDDHKLPTMQQRINLISKIADKLLSGDKECKDIFYGRIYNLCTQQGFINYDIAHKYHWTSPKTEKKFKKAHRYKKNLIKILFYKFMIFFMRRLKNRKKELKYARKYHKYSAKYKKYLELKTLEKGNNLNLFYYLKPDKKE